MTGSIRPFVALAVSLAALAVGCAADLSDDEASRPSSGLTWVDDVDLEGVDLAVGSKSTVEQEVLGWLAVEALAAAGADVVDQVGLGDTLEVRDALLGGLIDLYWEYTGTGWVDLLREIGSSRDPDELAEAVREVDLDENAVAWLTPAPANAAFGLIRGSQLDGPLDVDTVGELGRLLAEGEQGAVICVPAGGRFRADPDGLRALAEALELRERASWLVPVDGDDLVPAVEVGVFCPYGQVLRTSPQLVDADVALLEDDAGAFIARNPTVTVRAEVLAEHPGIEDVLDPVAAALTEAELQALNAAATGDGNPRAAARDWLVDQGLADR